MKTCHAALSAYILAIVFSMQARAQATQTRGIAAVEEARAEAAQTTAILGLSFSLDELNTLQKQRKCDAPPSSEELAIRQRLVESELMATLDADGVISEIATERAALTDLSTGLQTRRDRTVGLLNAGSLITGNGVGIAVNVAQLRNSTAIAGDYLGIGSGIASTGLALLAVRKSRGPKGVTGPIPNMLAPLFEREAQQHTFYPPSVMRFLESIPPGDDPVRGTRLDQMKSLWVQSGRTGLPNVDKDRAKLDVLTASANPDVKISIAEIADRVSMLNDVAGRVALMKRDLATLLHTYKAGVNGCAP